MANGQLNQQLGESALQTVYSHFEQRRASPRVRLRIPVQVGLPGGQIACARIYNLSPNGIQIRCDDGTAHQIHPSGETISNGSGPKVLLALRLKHGTNIHSQILRCKVFYVLPATNQEVIVGLEFEELNRAQRELVDTLMSVNLDWLE